MNGHGRPILPTLDKTHSQDLEVGKSKKRDSTSASDAVTLTTSGAIVRESSAGIVMSMDTLKLTVRLLLVVVCVARSPTAEEIARTARRATGNATLVAKLVTGRVNVRVRQKVVEAEAL